jgi:hypothetical protein
MRRITRAIAVSSLALPVALGGVATTTASASPAQRGGVHFHRGFQAANRFGAVRFDVSSGAFSGHRRHHGGGFGHFGHFGHHRIGGRSGAFGRGHGGWGGGGWWGHHRRHHRGGVYFNRRFLAAGPNGAVAFNTSSGTGGGWGPGGWGGGGWGPGGWGHGGVFFHQNFQAAGPGGAVQFGTDSGAR